MTSVHAGCCMAYFFLGFWAFACCIFFRRWANLVAGFRGAWRWFLDMLVVLRLNSTVGGQESVEWRWRTMAMYAKSLIVMLLIALPAAVPATAEPPDESALKQTYDAFVELLDHRSLAEDYLGAVRNLDSPDSKMQTVGIKTLAATDEVKVIPWIVSFLDSEDQHVRIHAGLSLNAIVASHQLKRRDRSQSEKIVILPPGPGDTDLKPMSWVILKMLRLPDDGNTHAYAANMIGYLSLEEYATELRGLLDSRHAAVTQAARWALEMIGAPLTSTPAPRCP